MSRIAAAFERARAEERAALVIYLCAGDPSLALTPRLIAAAAEAGADVIEVGVPFSDPTADGPTIQRASARALAAGASVRGVLDAVKAARALTGVPIVLFGYYNPVLRYGEAALCRDAHEAGVDGLLVVDLPPELGAPLHEPAAELGLDIIALLAPTSPDARVDAAAKVRGGFLYYVSMTGVTGSAGADLGAAARRAGEIEARTGRPVAVGFGVQSAADVARVATYASGVVVGSAVVRAIEAAPDDEAAIAALSLLVAELRTGVVRS